MRGVLLGENRGVRQLHVAATLVVRSTVLLPCAPDGGTDKGVLRLRLRMKDDDQAVFALPLACTREGVDVAQVLRAVESAGASLTVAVAVVRTVREREAAPIAWTAPDVSPGLRSAPLRGHGVSNVVSILSNLDASHADGDSIRGLKLGHIAVASAACPAH